MPSAFSERSDKRRCKRACINKRLPDISIGGRICDPRLSSLSRALALAVAFLSIPYGLTSFEFVFLLIGSELFVLISCLSAVLAQQQQYAWSSALLRLPNGLLIIPTGLMLVRRSWLSVHFILVAFLLLLFLGPRPEFRALENRRLERGREAITLKQRLPGFTFLVAIVAIIATQRGMITVAGAILTPERIAALAALIVLLRVFDLVGEPAGRVFATEMVREPHAITPALLATPWMLAGILSAVLLVALPPAVRHFYAGRATMPRCPFCHGWLQPARYDLLKSFRADSPSI